MNRAIVARFSKPSERSAGFSCAIQSANGPVEASGHVGEFYGTCGRFPSLPQLGELSDFELSDSRSVFQTEGAKRGFHLRDTICQWSERKRWGTLENVSAHVHGILRSLSSES